MIGRLILAIVSCALFFGQAAAQAPSGHRSSITHFGSYDDPRFIAYLESDEASGLRNAFLEEQRSLGHPDCQAIVGWERVRPSSGILQNPYLFIPGEPDQFDLDFPEGAAVPARAYWMETYQVDFCGEVETVRAVGAIQNDEPAALHWHPGHQSQVSPAFGARAANSVRTTGTCNLSQWLEECPPEWDPRVGLISVQETIPPQEDGRWEEHWLIDYCDREISVYFFQFSNMGSGHLSSSSLVPNAFPTSFQEMGGMLVPAFPDEQWEATNEVLRELLGGPLPFDAAIERREQEREAREHRREERRRRREEDDEFFD